MTFMPSDEELKKRLGSKITDILHPFTSEHQGTCTHCDYYLWKCWLCDCCLYCCQWKENEREKLECIKENKLDHEKLKTVETSEKLEKMKRKSNSTEEFDCKISKPN